MEYNCMFSVNVVVTRMNTLRTAFQKMISHADPSGSAPIPKTARLREIYRLCQFLICHVKTCASLSTYSIQSRKETLPPKVIKVSSM
jgi:hypothetical protein